MSIERPKGSYTGPLSLQWCNYSMTVRAMPMNYLAADLSRIDAALWGRESEIGAAIAEAPAMVEALRDALATIDSTLAARRYREGECTDSWSAEVRGEVATRARLRAILSRIDGAGDTLPDAPVPAPTTDLQSAARALLDAFGGDVPDWLTGEVQALESALNGGPAPTGELVTVRADHLAALVEAAGKYADDLETGLEDGTYDDRADLDAVQAAIAAVQGEKAPTGDASTCQHCGEERPLGPDGSVWTCGACNGLNCD